MVFFMVLALQLRKSEMYFALTSMIIFYIKIDSIEKDLFEGTNQLFELCLHCIALTINLV